MNPTICTGTTSSIITTEPSFINHEQQFVKKNELAYSCKGPFPIEKPLLQFNMS